MDDLIEWVVYLFAWPVLWVTRAADVVGKGLIYPFQELAGALVMRGLRRWAREYRVDAPFKLAEAGRPFKLTAPPVKEVEYHG